MYTVKRLSTVVVSVRVRKHLKEEAERLGIDVRRVVEEALYRAIVDEKKRKIVEALGELAASAGDISVEEWVEAVKASRRGRTAI